MTGRDKIEQAFSPEGTSAFGAVICYPGIFTRDHWGEVTDQPWWVMSSPDVDAKVEFYRDVIERSGQDWFVLGPGMSTEARSRLRIEEREDGVCQVDASGEARRLRRPLESGWNPGAECQSHRPVNPPLTHEAVDAMFDLSWDLDPDQPLAEGADELPRRLLAGPGKDVFPIAHVPSPLWSNHSVWGFEGLMTLLAEDRELVAHTCRRHVEQVRRSIAKMAAIGVRGIWVEECLTDMISPAAYRDLNLPYLREVIEAVRDAGMLSIYYFCGNPNDRWDLLLESGADALSLEESKKGFEIDIDRVVEVTRGRCVVLGNLDAMDLLRRGSEEALRAEISRQIEAGRRNKGRFIMSIGSPVTPETPPARVRLYADIVHELSPG